MSKLICPICAKDLGDCDKHSVTDCKHVFHTNCLKMWFSCSLFCPVCKENCSRNEDQPLYIYTYDDIASGDKKSGSFKSLQDVIKKIQDNQTKIKHSGETSGNNVEQLRLLIASFRELQQFFADSNERLGENDDDDDNSYY